MRHGRLRHGRLQHGLAETRPCGLQPGSALGPPGSGTIGVMPAPDPHRLAALIVELRRSLRRSAAAPQISADSAAPQEARSAESPAGQAGRLTPAEAEILRYVAAHPGQGTSGIATALRLRANTVSGLCSVLTRSGLLVRETDPADGRAAQFFLSTDATARRAVKMEHRSDRLERALGRLRAEDQQQIAAALPALEALADLLDADAQERTRP